MIFVTYVLAQRHRSEKHSTLSGYVGKAALISLCTVSGVVGIIDCRRTDPQDKAWLAWGTILFAKIWVVVLLAMYHVFEFAAVQPRGAENLASYLLILHAIPQVFLASYHLRTSWETPVPYSTPHNNDVGDGALLFLCVCASLLLLAGSRLARLWVERRKEEESLHASAIELQALKEKAKGLSEMELRLSQSDRQWRERMDRHSSFMVAACAELHNRSENIQGAISLAGDSGLSQEQRAPLELVASSLSTFVRDLSLFTRIADDNIELEG